MDFCMQLYQTLLPPPLGRDDWVYSACYWATIQCRGPVCHYRGPVCYLKSEGPQAPFQIPPLVLILASYVCTMYVVSHARLFILPDSKNRLGTRLIYIMCTMYDVYDVCSRVLYIATAILSLNYTLIRSLLCKAVTL